MIKLPVKSVILTGRRRGMFLVAKAAIERGATSPTEAARLLSWLRWQVDAAAAGDWPAWKETNDLR